ncbi:MAG: membrane protein insertase YidC [Pseudohongiellaceae bacterium]
MNQSTLTRFALYTALAVITYMMLLAWQEDYPPVVDDGAGQNAGQDAQFDQLPETPPPSASAGNVDVPTSLPTNANTSSTANDLPVPPQSTPVVTSQPDTASRNLVAITTDALELQIDLNGGDIVSLALPLYLKQLDVPDDPFEILESAPGRTYIAPSGLIGLNGIDADGRAIYQTSAANYVLGAEQDTLSVDLFHTAADGSRVIKRYTLHRGSYLIDVSFLVENNTAETWQATPFGQLRRDRFDDPTSVGGFLRTFLGFVSTTEGDPYMEWDFGDVDDFPQRSGEQFEETGGWIGFNQQYFVAAWVPPADSNNRYTIRRSPAGQYLAEFTSAPFTVAPGGTGDYLLQLYAGPKDKYALQEVSPNLDYTVDYSWLWFLAEPIHWLLLQINGLVVNWGLTIILLTFIVKAVFYKLSETQYRSMAGMRRLMPKMQQLKESYGDDRMQLQKATMDLYKKEKINPFGGCLPMLVQMPVFIALYWVLLESVELRHAPFILWINDLSVRDPFFVLPILMSGTMYLQTAISPAPADPMQAKVMKLMPVMMGALFLFFPAGLVLYWLVNSLLSILQQWYITRKIEAAYDAKKAKA